MLYMICVSVLSILGTINMLVATANSLDNMKVNKGPSAKLLIGVFVIVILTLGAISPMLFLMYQVISSFDNDAKAMPFENHSMAFQVVAAASSFIIACCYVYLAKKLSRKIGATGFIFSVMLLFIYGNSLAFITNDKVGVANITMLRSVSDIDDVNCNADFLLVSLSENASTPTKWRCPTALILFRDSSRPFMPFPDYQSGSSTKLSAALHTLINNSRDLSKE